MSSLPISKLVGTGNDFIFVDARKPLPGGFALVSRSEIARRLCDRHFGVGADGMVFVENAERAEADFKWDFYNTDGSFAEMCGNATRCMGRWTKLHLGYDSVRFETRAGMVDASVRGDDRIASVLSLVTADLRDITATVDGGLVKATLVNTGVPHAVIKVDDLDRVMLNQKLFETWIKAFRFHPEAGARGSNVTFMQIVGPAKISTKTFERGVEGFTLSCGTGVIASAAVCLQERGGLRAEVWTPGGSLEVEFGSEFRGVTLIGPAREVFETAISEEILR